MPKFKIETLTAFVAIDQDGEEGVMGALLGNTFYPLVCADEERIALMFPIAEDISSVTGQPYRIIQFTVRTDVTERYKK
jgi:hypothetical protein